MSTLAAVPQVSSVAVVNGVGYALTYQGMSKVDLTSGAVTGFVNPTNSSAGCVNASSGAGSSFSNATDVATDGQQLYVVDPTCGIVRVDPVTGATVTIVLAGSVTGSIRAVAVGPSGKVYFTAGETVLAYDPTTSAVTTVLATGFPDGFLPGIAADSTAVYVSSIRSDPASNAILQIAQPAGTMAILASDPQLGGAPSLLSAGDYLYSGVVNINMSSASLLRRYSKANGSWVNVAGADVGFKDGTGGDAWFNRVSGLAGDGTTLYVADASNDKIRKVVAAPALHSAQPPSANTASVISTGSVTTETRPVPGTMGIALIGVNLYALMSNGMVRVDEATGTVTPLVNPTGSPPNTCLYADSGAGSAFYDAGAVTTDGHFLYVLDHSCGILRVDPDTGATSAVMAAPPVDKLRALTMGPDGRIYATASQSVLAVDPQTSVVSTVLSSVAPDGILAGIAADSTAVYISSVRNDPANSVILKVSLPDFTVTTLAADRQLGNQPSLLSVGNYLYSGGFEPHIARTSVLRRYSKNNGYAFDVAGLDCCDPALDPTLYYGNHDGVSQNARFTTIIGLASDGTSLFVADRDANAIRKVVEVPPQAAMGQTGPMASAGGGNGAMANSQCSCHDPVNTATGELWETTTDLTLPGRVPVAATRTYSSLAAGTSGLFGNGWASPWQAHLTAGPTVTVAQENGAQVTFTTNADGSFTAPANVQATLARNATSGIYTFVRRNDTTMLFDSTGLLTDIKDRNGETTHLTRSASQLTVFAPDGRTLTFTLDASGRATSLAGPSGSRTVGYHYNPAGNLDQVTDPRGKVETYGYDPTSGRMTTKTTPVGEVTTTHYDGAGRVDSQTNPRGGTTTFAYSVSGEFETTRMVDPTGLTTDFFYQRGVQTGRTVDPDGAAATWSFTYDLAGDQTSSTDPTGLVSSATFDANGNPTQTMDAAQKITTTTFNAFNEPLTSTSGGPTTTWTYDSTGNVLTQAVKRSDTVTATTTWTRGTSAHPADVTAVTDPDGKITSSTYSPEGFVASRTAGDGGKTTWTYDAYGDALTTVSPRGNVSGGTPATYRTTSTYDAGSNLLTQTDPLGHASTWTYDDDSRPLTVTDPLGKVSTDSYWPDGTLKTHTDPLSRVTSYTYDLNGQRTSVTAPDGAISTSSYDSHGYLVASTKPSGNVSGATSAQKAAATTTFSNDLAGRVLTSSVPDPAHPGQNLTTTTTYDAAGRPRTVTDPAGHATTTSYDVFSQVISETDPAGATSTFGYDLAGSPTTSTDPLGHVSTSAWTPAGRAASSTDPAGDITSNTYDSSGRLASTVSPRGNCSGCTAANYRTSYGYDLDGNPTTVTDPLGHVTTTAYDAAGRTSSVTDAKAHATAYTYDNADQLKTVKAPDTGTVTYNYDAAGQLVSLISPRGATSTWTYSYDAAGRLLSTTDPLSKTQSRTYTVDGQVATDVTARGTAATNHATGTITYGYDTLDRPTSTTYGDGAPTVTLGYDADSRVISQTDAGTGTQTYGYDPTGRLTSLQRGTTNAWGWTYNSDGTLKTATRPDGSTETSTYDVANRKVTVASPNGSTAYTFDQDGNPTTAVLPNGNTETTNWDPAGYVASIKTTRGATTVVGQTVTRDAVNNPTQTVVTRGSSTETRSYLYDPNNRLTAVCYTVLTSCTGASPATQAWTYDLAGNRLTEKNGTGTGTTSVYTYNNADQIATRKVGTNAAVTYTHDADGNLLSDGTTVSTYDLNNRRTTAANGGVTTTYTRDAQGNMLRSAASGTGGTVTDYLWDQSGTVPQLAQTSSAGTVTALYRYDPTGRTQTVTAAGVSSWASHDPIGSVTDLSNTAGTLTRSYDYTPFGTSRTAVGAPPASGPNSRLQFANMLTDPAGGTVSYSTRDRTYIPGNGQFTSTDPVGPDPSNGFDSSYNYTGNQPTLLIDPLGDNAISDFFTKGNPISRGAEHYTPALTNDVRWTATHTVGGCVNASAAFGYSVTGSVCLVTVNGQVRWMRVVGAGLGTPGASVTGGIIVSNATEPCQLGGWFGTAGASAGEGRVVGDEVSGGHDAAGNFIWENQVFGGFGIDPGIHVEGEGHGAATYTWISH